MAEGKGAAVLIPVYREKLTELEGISLRQAVTILKAHDIYLIMPELLHIHTGYELNEERFPNGYFDSVHSYNRLMLSTEFYERFSRYKYILIYQLDAFVFSDRLEYFCSMGYDYIGAPWIDGAFYYRDSGHMFWHVGNGGLSLRRVGSFINALRSSQELLVNNRVNEDLIFSALGGESFHVAPESAALEFSFEMNVRECYERNGRRLPFGCHAWHKYDLPFWKPWIEGYGYIIRDEVCREGQEDASPSEDMRRKRKARFGGRAYKGEELRALIPRLFGGGGMGYAIWGAGFWGQMLCRMLEDAGVPVHIFIDRQKGLEGCRICGHEIIAPEALAKCASKFRIVVAVEDGQGDIGDFLDGQGYSHGLDYVYFQEVICPLKYGGPQLRENGGQ